MAVGRVVVLMSLQNLRVEAEMTCGLSGYGGSSGGGGLFGVRGTSALAVAVHRRGRTQRHGIGLLDQVAECAQIVKVG